MNPIHELTGYLAATLTTISFVPQVLRTLRTRDTRAISLGIVLPVQRRGGPVAGLRPADRCLAHHPG
jgi:hypothetical protein